MLRFGQDYADIGAEAYEAQYQRKRLVGIKAAAKDLGLKLVPTHEEQVFTATM